MAPTLGIAVVHYRTPEVALDCLVRLRSAAPEAELVLVDAAPCAAFEARLEAELPGVLFLPVPNHSYARSVNIGVAALKTDYVALMNADVLVEEETLDLLLAALEEEPGCGLVGPLALTPAGRPQPMGLPYELNYLKLAARRGTPSPRSVEVPWLSGCMQLTRRSVWEESGGYDEAFRFFNEDLDFSLRLRALGHACRLVDAPVVHLGGASTPAHPAFQLEGRRGGMLVSRRHASPAFAALHQAFLWAEALSGRLLARSAERRALSSWLLDLLRRGAWGESPFGATLDERREP